MPYVNTETPPKLPAGLRRNALAQVRNNVGQQALTEVNGDIPDHLVRPKETPHFFTDFFTQRDRAKVTSREAGDDEFA
jgi:hypothetical protein